MMANQRQALEWESCRFMAFSLWFLAINGIRNFCLPLHLLPVPPMQYQLQGCHKPMES
jgi:hypothetical protein